MNTKFFITTKEGKVVGLSYDKEANTFKTVQEYITESTKENARINILNMLLLQMRASSSEKPQEIVTFYVPSIVTDKINKGSFRQWIATGKTLSGSEINPTEIKLWQEFVKLMKKHFDVFTIKDITTASSSRYYKGVKSNDTRITEYLAGQAWEAVDKLVAPAMPKAE